MHFIAFSWNEFEADTRHISALETGIYIRLLNHYYQRGPGITTDMHRLESVAGIDMRSQCERNAVAFVASEFFTENDGKLFHKRADKELQKALEKSEKAKESARCRWDANAKRTQSERNANKSKNIYIDIFWRENDLQDAFIAFRKMRREIKAPLNQTAESRLISKLKTLAEQGHSMRDLLETATANCWKSVYAPKEQHRGQRVRNSESRSQTPGDRAREASRRYLESDVCEVLGADG